MNLLHSLCMFMWFPFSHLFPSSSSSLCVGFQASLAWLLADPSLVDWDALAPSGDVRAATSGNKMGIEEQLLNLKTWL